ncbi:hypothetical protein PoMZ_00724 [Pyricularia oryzae]|uniref:Uncharacterized protein n=1 Tax=Pyricularia oryzae TaxID=318829 RepID=A0A4P7N2X0_PYROR|nr:hypothetical protein PoMZ_00724 [Pyricularia oryzae]
MQISNAFTAATFALALMPSTSVATPVLDRFFRHRDKLPPPPQPSDGYAPMRTDPGWYPSRPDGSHSRMHAGPPEQFVKLPPTAITCNGGRLMLPSQYKRGCTIGSNILRRYGESQQLQMRFYGFVVHLPRYASGLKSRFLYSQRGNATSANALADVKVELLDRYQVELTYPQGTWQRQAYDDFVGALISPSKTFPCVYGTKGFKANELDFVFLDSEELGSAATAKLGAKAILEYHQVLEGRGRNISLVMLCPPPERERSVHEYHDAFWAFLHRLRQLDPKPWPAQIPRATGHVKWCMNFDGVEAFFAVLTPAHRQRLSRHAPNFAMVYQPRYIFDAVFKNARYRESATKMIRGLVDRYDEIPHSPEISDYGLPGTTESRQYFLLDENVPSKCPYESLDDKAPSN